MRNLCNQNFKQYLSSNKYFNYDRNSFFNENNVQVTNARFVVFSQTYAMNGITSVKYSREDPSRILPIIAFVIGICSIFDSPVIGLISISIAIALYMMNKTKHLVVLNTSGGQVEALSSTDNHHIIRIVAALNVAIIHRG
jgi:Family of unknown function (DUF6232)